MTPVLFAAALTLSPAVAQSSQGLDLRFTPPPARAAQAAEACARLGRQTVAPDGTPMLRKLGDLPPALLEHAVWRRVAGCPVREIVYQGQTYYLGSSLPRMESGPAVENRVTRPGPASPNAPPSNRWLEPPMIPLILAAALLTAPASSAAPNLVKPDLLKGLGSGRDCSDFSVQTAWSNGGKVQKLTELPPGLLEHAVLRSIHGCPVREIMSAGGTYYLGVPMARIEGLSPASGPAAPTTRDR